MADASVTEVTVAKVEIIPWWLILIEGLAALIIGLSLVMNPVGTTTFLIWVLGWYWLITGVLTLVMLFIDRTDAIWKIVAGALGIIAGLIVIAYPMFAAAIVPATLVIIVGILGLAFGCVSLYWALKQGWGAALMGVLSIIFGLLLLGSPMVAVTLLIYLLGGLAIIGGIITMYMAFKLK